MAQGIAEAPAREYVEFTKELLYLLMVAHDVTPSVLAYEIGVTELTVCRWLAGVRIPRDAMWRATQRLFDTY